MLNLWFGNTFSTYTELNYQTVLFLKIQFSISQQRLFQVLLCIINNSIKYQLFVYTQLNDQTLLFKKNQFSIFIQFSSIWPIDWTLSSANTPGQNEPGSDANKGVFCIAYLICKLGSTKLKMHPPKPKPCNIVWNEQLRIGLHVNAHKTEYMCFNQRGDISTLNGSSLKLVDKFTDLGSSISSTETDINTRLTKV